MVPFQIKICGVTTCDDARLVCSSGADAIGLNFYERSSRYVDGETAGAIATSVDEQNRKMRENGYPKVKKIGVFVDMAVADMVAIAWHVGLDGIQLHGDESPGIVGQLRDQLDQAGHDCFLVRALRTKPAGDLEGSQDSDAETKRMCGEIKQWMDQGIDIILLDAAVSGEYGGTGKTVDLAILPKLDHDLPFVLAGGLTPENVAAAIRKSGFKSVDVASGVESAPGVKSHQKIKDFVSAAQSAFEW